MMSMLSAFQGLYGEITGAMSPSSRKTARETKLTTATLSRLKL